MTVVREQGEASSPVRQYPAPGPPAVRPAEARRTGTGCARAPDTLPPRARASGGATPLPEYPRAPLEVRQSAVSRPAYGPVWTTAVSTPGRWRTAPLPTQ